MKSEKRTHWLRTSVIIGILAYTFTSCAIGHAQETTDSSVLPLNGTNMMQLRLYSNDQLTALVNTLNATPTVSSWELPAIGGTFWSLAEPGCPFPSNMFGFDCWQLSDGAYLMNDWDFDYDAPVPSRPMMMSAMDSTLPPGFSGGSGGTNYFPGLSFTFDPGTNLWILETNLSSGVVSGLVSNTAPGVRLELQYTFDLAQPWQSADWFVYGSQITNWTAFSVPAVSSSNLFLRVKSWDVDANGLPIWWEQQYGLTNIDPNSLSAAGDGWTIYQKYSLGVAPDTWYTPAAPQGLTVSFNQSALTAAISWLPSRGNVASYAVEKSYQAHLGGSTQTSDYTVSSGTTYQDNISGNNPDVANGNAYNVYYKVKANYQNGNSSGWTPLVPLQQTTVAGAITPGANGLSTLVAMGIPAGASLIRLVFIDESAVSHNNNSFNYTEDISVSSFTNGLYPMPMAWNPPSSDSYGNASYAIFVKSVDSSGNPSAPNLVTTNWSSMPFYDGRAQLKENLIFQLRAAPSMEPLLIDMFTNGYSNPYVKYYYPSNYACAGLYPFTGPEYGGNLGNLDIFLPFEENCLFRNLVFSLSDIDNGGNLTTGAGSDTTGTFDLIAPLTYSFDTNANTFPDLLSASASQWLLPFISDGFYGFSSIMVYQYSGTGGDMLGMYGNVSNWFGLPYVSVELANGNTSSTVTALYPGGAVDVNNWAFSIPYFETAQPQFQTVKYCFYQSQYDWLPGSMYFSPTNDSPLLVVSNSYGYTATNDVPYLIVPAGTWTKLAGYAKLAVTNAAPGVFGYLGQYFQAAYQVDGSGNITTNSAGVISPYGDYLSTAVGQAALVTLPDLDTGLQGTCMVYSVALALDKNHDGNIDLSLGSADATSTNSPFVFWCNNNFDRGHKVDGDDFEQDDLTDMEIATLPAYQQVPDCNYTNGSGQSAIPSTRDLEDYFRLWLPGMGSLMKVLPTNYTARLTLSGNGQLRLFQAYESNGGTNYLFDEATASNQVASSASLYVGLLTSSSPVILPVQTNFNEHFICCGVQDGDAQVDLQILDGKGKKVADASTYLQIVDIKQMYERWTVGEDPNVAPLNTPTNGSEDLPVGAPVFQYAQPTDTNTPYILLVHGWNMQRADKDRYAEAAYKRLYWQGYSGRFGVYRWPTGNGISDTLSAVLNARNYDSSEFTAWQSAVGLTNLLTQLNAEHAGHVYLMAHSMGNVVAGEALRLASSQLVNTYIAMQGAVPAHAYDPNTTTRAIIPIFGLGGDDGTPNRYAYYYTDGSPCYFSASAGAGAYVNFYNTNDYALSANLWQFNQNLKPDNATTPAYHYVTPSSTHPSGFYRQSGSAETNLNFPADTYELFAYADEARCYALGAEAGITTFNRKLDLQSIWPPDNSTTDPSKKYSVHKWHSAEFRSDNPSEALYWNSILGNIGFKLK